MHTYIDRNMVRVIIYINARLEQKEKGDVRRWSEREKGRERERARERAREKVREKDRGSRVRARTRERKT